MAWIRSSLDYALSSARRGEPHLILRARRSLASRRMLQRAAPEQRYWMRPSRPLRGASGRGGTTQNFRIRTLEPFALEFTRGPPRRVSSPTRAALARARAQALVGEDQGGGRAILRDRSAAAHSIISSARATPHPRPPPHRASGRTPVSRRAMGGGCANGIDSAQMQQACLMTFRATEARRNRWERGQPSRQRRGSDREHADRLTGRVRV